MNAYAIPAWRVTPDVLAGARRFDDPFPHAIIDDFLPQHVLAALVREFPPRDWEAWTQYGPGHGWRSPDKDGDKVGQSDERHFGPVTRHVAHELNGATWIWYLEQMMGVPGLVPDPTFSGCGLHSTGRGGRLLVHVDADRHPVKAMRQRLNLILFLNPDWREEWGGHLELWDWETRKCAKRIAPKLGRAVIFETNRQTLHGHPQPLACPPERRRNTLAVYYYTVGGPEEHSEETPWVPGSWKDALLYWDAEKARRVARSCLPPVLVEAWRRAGGRFR